MSEPSLECKNWTWIFPKTPEVNLSHFAIKDTLSKLQSKLGEEWRAAAWLVGGPQGGGRGLPDRKWQKERKAEALWVSAQ